MRAAKSAGRAGTSASVGIMETNVFGRVDYSADARHIDVHLLLSKWCLWKWRQWSRSVRPKPLGLVLPNLVMHEGFYPIAPQLRAAFRERCAIPTDALLFGRVGSPIESKWSHATLEAFAIYAQANHNAWLLLVGVSDELRAAVQAMSVSVRRRIVVIDFLHGDHALREAYSSMDVFLHASRIGESFGMVLAEALCCRTPVITLSTPLRDNSQLEVVGHEEGGLAVASISAMVQAMRKLEDPALREHYAGQGASRIIHRYGPERLIPQAIEIARLVAQGLSRPELADRLSAIPGICTQVSGEEIRSLMRRCMGEYSAATPTLLTLISNPFLYRAYRAVTR
jgi:glycosyltransferase involved in cell wall biosynthesis